MPVQSQDLKNGQPVNNRTGPMAMFKPAARSVPPVQPAPAPQPPPPPEQPRRAPGRDWSLTVGKLAVWLAVLAFGGIWWCINGGYSVIGLEPAAAAFGWIGNLGYALVANWTFIVDLPSVVEQQLGIPRVQPVLPWVGVIAASALQIVVTYRRRAGKSLPLWMIIAAILLSLYDLGTTWFGLGTTSWIKQAGAGLQTFMALLLTFGLEGLIGFLLPHRK